MCAIVYGFVISKFDFAGMVPIVKIRWIGKLLKLITWSEPKKAMYVLFARKIIKYAKSIAKCKWVKNGIENME